MLKGKLYRHRALSVIRYFTWSTKASESGYHKLKLMLNETENNHRDVREIDRLELNFYVRNSIIT